MKILTKKNMTIFGIVCVIAALYGIIKSVSQSVSQSVPLPEKQFEPLNASYSTSADGASPTQQDDALSLTSTSNEHDTSSQDGALTRTSNKKQQNSAKEADSTLDKDANGISDKTANKASNTPPSKAELALAQTAVKTANLLKQEGNFAHNASEQAYNELRGAAVGLANNELSSFLNRYGTARVQLNVDNKFRLTDSAIDVLFPLFETKSSLTFTQVGLRYNNQDERTIGNFGLGQRYFIDDFMLGYNGFFDYDFSRHHSRLGLGLEFAKDYLRLTSNGYIGLSDWKDSKDFYNYEERAASGFDALLEAYYPSYPQLGLNLKVEAYWGEEVALISKDKLEKNPVAFTGGLTYTPVPLVTLGASYTRTNRHNDEAKFNVDVNYAFGVPLGQQLDGSNVDSLRSLMGSRYALVERNNNIVLEYKKKTGIELTLPAKVSGYSGEMKLVTAKVKAANGLDHVEWDGSAIAAIGGEVIAKDTLSSQIKLPAYQYGDNANNNHKVTAIAYDRQGNTSSRESVEVEVFETKVSAANSTFEASPAEIVADGKDTSTLTLTLKDKNAAAILGAEKGLTFKVDGVDDDKTTFSDVRALGEGRYEVDFSGRAVGVARITPVITDYQLSAKTLEVQLNSVGGESVEHSTLNVMPNKALNPSAAMNDEAMIVDDKLIADIEFTLKNENNEPIFGNKDITLSFLATNQANDTKVVDMVSNIDTGVYQAKLAGKKIGEGDIAVYVGKQKLKTHHIKLLPQKVDMVKVTGGYTKGDDAPSNAPESGNSLYDGKRKIGEKITLQAYVTDKFNNPVANEVINLAVGKSTYRDHSGAGRSSILFDGQEELSLKSNKDGMVSFNVSDDKGTGAKTEIFVITGDATNPEKATFGKADVIFTRLNSPDSPFAKYWGHMSEKISLKGFSSLTRPKLAKEIANSQAQEQFGENWAKVDFATASKHCQLPSTQNLISVYNTYTKEGLGIEKEIGWPVQHIVYRASDVHTDEGRHWGVSLNNGTASSAGDDGYFYISCIAK